MTSTQPVKIWTTRIGQEIPLPDMSDSHLANAIAYMERTAEARRDAELEYLIHGPQPRGEGAQDCFDAGMQQLYSMTPDEYLETDDAYQSLIEERERREALL